MTGVGLGRGREVGPDHGVEVAGEVQGLEDGRGQAGQLVGADGQPGAGGAQGLKALRHAGEGPGEVGAVEVVVGDEALEEGLQGRPLDTQSLGLEAALEEAPGAVADQAAALVKGQGGDPFFGQQVVEGRHKVGGGVHQGAVQVEGDDGAGQGLGFGRHGRSCSGPWGGDSAGGFS